MYRVDGHIQTGLGLLGTREAGNHHGRCIWSQVSEDAHPHMYRHSWPQSLCTRRVSFTFPILFCFTFVTLLDHLQGGAFLKIISSHKVKA